MNSECCQAGAERNSCISTSRRFNYRLSAARCPRYIAKSTEGRLAFGGALCHHWPYCFLFRDQSPWHSGDAGRRARPDLREPQRFGACGRPRGPCAGSLVPPDPARPGARELARSIGGGSGSGRKRRGEPTHANNHSTAQPPNNRVHRIGIRNIVEHAKMMDHNKNEIRQCNR